MVAAFSLEHVSVTLGGHLVRGFADEDDALMLPDAVSFFEVSRGADGSMEVMRNGVKGGELQLKLQPSSPSVQFFMNQVSLQMGDQGSSGTIVSWQGEVIDSRNGAKVTLSDGVLTEAPLGQTYGAGAAATMVFKWQFEIIKPDWAQADYSLTNAVAPN